MKIAIVGIPQPLLIQNQDWGDWGHPWPPACQAPIREKPPKAPKVPPEGHQDQEPAPCLTLESAVLRNILLSFVILCKVLFRRPAEGPALFCLTRSNGPLHALRNRLTLPFSGCLICSRCLVTSVVTDFLGILASSHRGGFVLMMAAALT